MGKIRDETDGERILQVVAEVKQLRQEVVGLRVAQEQADRYLRLFERFMGLAEGCHLRDHGMMAEEPYPQHYQDLTLARVEELAKAMDVEDTLKAKEDQEDQ